ncbi:MAG: exopolyphosphatase, partial [Flavobacteriaceae bacterium]|nr:exopolyphosphatase [Flavobacteriaceae bacterium]
MRIHKYAAIDIGSNGVRLLIANVIVFKKKETQFKKSSLVRVPIRLGADVFTTGFISENNKIRICDAIQAFELLMKVHGVEKYKACATSAMREAKNGNEIAESILNKTGIKIDIIDGKTEAEIISSTDLSE